jgi:hypothetical protein
VVVLADRKYSGIESGHGRGSLPNRFIWTCNANVPRHGFTDFHHFLLSHHAASEDQFDRHC